jgi:F-type H+-transporting ATPase subunit delta
MKHLNEAKPYSDAAFLFAKEHKQVEVWRAFLEAMAGIFADTEVKRLLKNPQVTKTVLIDILNTAFEKTTMEMSNFLKLLAEKQRLNLLPEIYELFLHDWQRDQSLVEVTLTFAEEPKSAELKSLEPILTAKFGKHIKQNIAINKNLLSGVVIESGDYVLDASLRGQLETLKTELMRP